MNKTSDFKFVLLLFTVIILSGLISYLNSQNLLRAKEAIAKAKNKVKDDTAILLSAKERVRDTCLSNFAKSSLKNRIRVFETYIDCEINKVKNRKAFTSKYLINDSDKLIFKDNKICYTVPLINEKIKVEFDEISNNITISVPSVRLDVDSIGIQTNSSFILKNGNNSMQPVSLNFDDLNKEALEDIKDTIVKTAERQPDLKPKAKEQAKMILYDFFSMILSDILRENKIGLEIYVQ